VIRVATVEVSADTHNRLADMKYDTSKTLGRVVPMDEIIRALLDFREDAIEELRNRGATG